MFRISETTKSLFPVNSIKSLKLVIKDEVEKGEDANLTLLSILIGCIESFYTKPFQKCENTLTTEIKDPDAAPPYSFPLINFSFIELLHDKFVHLINTTVNPLLEFSNLKYASRSLIKKVSDVVWSTLAKSYFKDKAHLQSLFSYLTVKKLDCFGLAFAVVAGCQILGFRDVHLALSEDHAWVLYGEFGDQTAEVTWHGKGNEDKRGQPIMSGVGAKSWLYANDHPVACNRAMEVAAIVSSINPCKTSNTSSPELEMLQQELLWFLHDLHHLDRYPLALELRPLSNRPSPLMLYESAVKAAQSYYANQYVYPYTLLGAYHYHHQQFKAALRSWSAAADVIRQYNYSREDEEVYKEFLEIASEYLPGLIRTASSDHNQPLTRDPECFAFILNFFDGLCEWEEDSVTPVLHIGWAKPLMGILVKFDAKVRSQVVISYEVNSSSNASPQRMLDSISVAHEKAHTRQMSLRCKRSPEEDREHSTKKRKTSEYSVQYLKDIFPTDTQELIQDVELDASSTKSLHPCISRLLSACSENILNPEYLLGFAGSQPFASISPCSCDVCCNKSESWSTNSVDVNSNDFNTKNPKCPSESQSSGLLTMISAPSSMQLAVTKQDDFQLSRILTARPLLHLHSKKMIGIKDLLFSEKLNTQAISLQLTAQSQVHLMRK